MIRRLEQELSDPGRSDVCAHGRAHLSAKLFQLIPSFHPSDRRKRGGGRAVIPGISEEEEG